MELNFKNLPELFDYFHDDKTCFEFLAQAIWDNGQPVCPHCGSTKVYTTKTRSKSAAKKDVPEYRCAEKGCNKNFAVTVGTIFEGSKVPLRKWFAAIWLCTTNKKGISSLNLAGQLGITQKTAWFVLHRVRTMLTETEPKLLTGTVEGDECFVGGKNKNRHWDKKIENSQGRACVDKTPVLGLIQRDGNVRTFVIPNTEAATLQAIMVANVAKEAVLITDAYRSYNGLEKVYNHVTVKHSEGNFVTDRHFHTNNIEGYWSILKRGVIGVYHYVSPKHLHRYCNEFASRYNTRKDSNEVRFANAVKACRNARITYGQLTK